MQLGAYVSGVLFRCGNQFAINFLQEAELVNLMQKYQGTGIWNYDFRHFLYRSVDQKQKC